MSNTITATENKEELKARIKAFMEKYLEIHRQELYPSGGLDQRPWVYQALAEFVESEVKAAVAKTKN